MNASNEISINHESPQRWKTFVLRKITRTCHFLLQNYNEQGLVNIGCGTDASIKELAEIIVAEVGYEGQLVFDIAKPDGTPRKLMDISKINNLDWIQSIDLK